MNEKKSSAKVISWISKNFKFLFIPGYRLKELTIKERKYEKTISKRKFLQRLKSKLTILGIILIFLEISLVIFAPWISPYTYKEAMGGFPGDWAPPSPGHPLGQSRNGRDVLSRIIFGTQSSLIISGLSVSISVIIGTIIGLIAAYYGKWLDLLLMRIMDIILAFPGIVLAIFVIIITRPTSFAPLEQSFKDIIFIFGIIGIPYFARLIRGLVLQVRELPYINSAKAIGAKNYRIMFKHILPNCIQPIIISISFKIGSTVLGLTVLSYLGYGDPSIIEWGADISAARFNIIDAPWASLWPCFMISITVLGFMLLGDGLRDVLDPRVKEFSNFRKKK